MGPRPGITVDPYAEITMGQYGAADGEVLIADLLRV